MNAAIASNAVAHPTADEHHDPSFAEVDLSKQYPTPSPESVTSFAALKDRIRHHYELASDYYYSLWGEHLHHGYFLDPADTKERAQTRLIELLLERARLEKGLDVLDIGCGMGGTSRFLAKHHACNVTGLTISGKQVEMAVRLSADEAGVDVADKTAGDAIKLGPGSARFIELDAEELDQHFPENGIFNCVWIFEALSHLPDKKLFFRNATRLLTTHGKLVIADWFKADDLTLAQMEANIKPIEDGMLLPPLCTQSEYTRLAEEAGLQVFSESLDISQDVAKTWDISWSLIQSPALWAFAFSQGRDGIAFLQAFRAMRRGYANGTFRYAVMVFQKPVM
ncbi:MAG: hypothetical protein LQ345_005381 [Seirophora villosa]|nr:MAG: hypothetical protein LQ345_005381 [Seirophora villosa]